MLTQPTAYKSPTYSLLSVAISVQAQSQVLKVEVIFNLFCEVNRYD